MNGKVFYSQRSIAKLKASKDKEIAKLMASKDEEIAKLKASKDEEIAELRALKDEVIDELVDDLFGMNNHLASKDKEIATLKQSLKRRESALLKQYHMTSKPLVDKVDLTSTDDNDDEPSSKRRKCIAGMVLEEKEKRLVKIKQEQVETRAYLEDVREDLDIANDTVTQQAVFTDAWQSSSMNLLQLLKLRELTGEQSLRYVMDRSPVSQNNERFGEE